VQRASAPALAADGLASSCPRRELLLDSRRAGRAGAEGRGAAGCRLAGRAGAVGRGQGTRVGRPMSLGLPQSIIPHEGEPVYRQPQQEQEQEQEQEQQAA